MHYISVGTTLIEINCRRITDLSGVVRSLCHHQVKMESRALILNDYFDSLDLTSYQRRVATTHYYPPEEWNHIA